MFIVNNKNIRTTPIYLVAISYLKVMKRAASDKHRKARKIKESDKK